MTKIRNEHGRVILADCDGVLVDWFGAFVKYVEKRGFRHTCGTEQDHFYLDRCFEYMTESHALELAYEFNRSPEMARLPAFRDSQQYVKKLYDEYGYHFHVITSAGDHVDTEFMRNLNLSDLFGNAISRLVLLPLASPKETALAEYADSGLWWVEDNVTNFATGIKLGLRSVLMQHTYNSNHNTYPGYRARNWQQFYGLVKQLHILESST